MLGTVQWQRAEILLVDKASQFSHLRGELKAFIYYVHFGHLFYAKRNQQERDVMLKIMFSILGYPAVVRAKCPSLTPSEIG
ncbi:MAG: hypothetical protein VW349_08840, partial [Gammaproteobacteria bacterium]